MGVLGAFFKRKKKLTPAELEFIRNQSRIIADSVKIIGETDNIETFFSRFALIEKTVGMVSEVAGGDTKCIAGNQVSPGELSAMLQNEKVSITNGFLDRYIRKETVHILGLSRGQLKKAHGVAAIIDEYADNMPEESLEYGHTLCGEMIGKIEKVAGK